MSLLKTLVAELDAIKARGMDLLEPERAVAAKLEQIVRAGVDEIHALEARVLHLESLSLPTPDAAAPEPSTAPAQVPSEAASAPAAPQDAQPAVAENTGSGAAPSDPNGPASAGAVQSPTAAGAAPIA